MIDLHSHLLPAWTMVLPTRNDHSNGENAVADGITVQACTPHILPGVYNNVGRDIRARVAHLQFRLHEAGVP